MYHYAIIVPNDKISNNQTYWFQPPIKPNRYKQSVRHDNLESQLKEIIQKHSNGIANSKIKEFTDKQSQVLCGLVELAEQYYNAGMFDQAQGMLITIGAMAQEIGAKDIQQKVGVLYDKIVKEK